MQDLPQTWLTPACTCNLTAKLVSSMPVASLGRSPDLVNSIDSIVMQVATPLLPLRRLAWPTRCPTFPLEVVHPWNCWRARCCPVLLPSTTHRGSTHLSRESMQQAPRPASSPLATMVKPLQMSANSPVLEGVLDLQSQASLEHSRGCNLQGYCPLSFKSLHPESGCLCSLHIILVVIATAASFVQV